MESLLINECEEELFDFEELNDDESMVINGGGEHWLGSCVVAGSACNLNNGGLSWGVCVCLGLSWGEG